MTRSSTRRSFIRRAAAAAALGPVALAALSRRLDAAVDDAKPFPKLRKAVKYGMIGINGSVEEKFALVKSLGFQGVEVDGPGGINREEALKAKEKTGIQIHGVIDSVHWDVRLSDPNADVRAKALEALRGAIKDCHVLGGSTVLLVPGAVRDPKNENFDQVWERSTAEVRKVLPEAKSMDVKIAIEVVWNDFLTTPENFIKYIDQFNDPTVGGYFDCSNMIKYGVAPADWIRKLGRRMLKFDFKGYSKAKAWVNIGEGDENWPEILKALAEIKYDGWATAEVGAGGKEHLQDVAKRMNQVLGLG